jgi:hypothetical protein
VSSRAGKRDPASSCTRPLDVSGCQWAGWSMDITVAEGIGGTLACKGGLTARTGTSPREVWLEAFPETVRTLGVEGLLPGVSSSLCRRHLQQVALTLEWQPSPPWTPSSPWGASQFGWCLENLFSSFYQKKKCCPDRNCGISFWRISRFKVSVCG